MSAPEKKSISIFVLLVLSLGVASLGAAEVTVFAAASLAESLKQISTEYQRKSGDKIVLNFGASSLLARQIEEGAPADIFFSADDAKMDVLERKGLIFKETRINRLSNSLVIVIPSNGGAAIHSAKDLATEKIKRLALAEPTSVPAGIYGKEYLQKTGLWKAVSGKVIPTENVRAALAAVESGNAEAAIVYKTDAAISRKIKVACELPPSDSPKINYPMAVMKESKQPEAARKFLRYLDSEAASKTFKQFGFVARRNQKPE